MPNFSRSRSIWIGIAAGVLAFGSLAYVIAKFPPNQDAFASHGASVIGMQVSESGCGSLAGQQLYTPSTGGASEWITDGNEFDPNCARIYISNFTGWDLDFKIGVQVSDGPNHGGGCGDQAGNPAWTPWASEGGGLSGWASDYGAFDPNCYKIFVATRPLPAGINFVDARVGVQLSDNACRSQVGTMQYSPWARSGGGWSSWAVDSPSSPADPDCMQLGLEVKIVKLGTIEVKTLAGTNPPPPAVWVIKNSAGNVVAQEGDGATTATYNDLPESLYTISEVPQTVTHQGRTYVLTSITPSNSQPLGNASTCGTGQSNPHVTCVSGTCTAVASCGPSDCTDCQSPRGDREPPIHDREVFFRAPSWIAVAHAAIDEGGTNWHKVCNTQEKVCTSVAGAGDDECQEHTDCGGSPPPPPPPPQPPAAPKITFTLNYSVANQSLNVDLTAAAATGGPRDVTLRADVGGSAQGTINYNFWWNCSYGGTNLATAKDRCGTPSATGNASGIKFDNTNTDPQTVVHNYTTSSIAKVIVERANAPAAQDQVSIQVTGGPGGEDPILRCATNDTTPYVNQQATFTATGGTGTFSWSGGGTPATGGNSDTFRTTFINPGPKTVTVTRGAQTATCPITVLRIGALDCGGPTTGVTGQALTFTATNGSGNYSWSGGGTPATGGNNASFTTTFTATGRKVVTVTRGTETASCEVEITQGGPPPGGQTCTIRVNSNAPTNWLIGGPNPDGAFIRSTNYPSPISSDVHTTDSSGNNLPRGTYSIMIPNEVNGWTSPTVAPASAQWCPDGGSITFNITYHSTPQGLTCSTDQAFVNWGDQVTFTATNGSGNYSWSGGGAPQTGTGATFQTRFNSSGEKTVTLSDGSATDTCTVNVFPPTPPVLCSGPSELDVNENGTWYANGGNGEFAWSASAQGWGDAVPRNGNGPSFTTRFTFQGQKVVTVWSGSQNRHCIVNVVQGDGVHMECSVNRSCVQVAGDGVDRCNTNSDCGGGGTCTGPNCTPPPFHGVCDAAQRACVNRSGSGGGSCADDPACAGVTDSHLECRSNACVIVSGAGANTCDTVGESCTVDEPPVGENACTFDGTPRVIARGDSSSLGWQCTGGGITSCTIRNARTGEVVSSGGAAGSVSVAPPNTTTYRLQCGGISKETTVRVLSIIEIPPR